MGGETQKAVFREDYGTIGVQQFSIDWNGWNFLIIYGRYVNDWFIAIPNWEICVKATEPDNVYYNIDKLSQAFNDGDKGRVVAEAIKEHWKGTEINGEGRKPDGGGFCMGNA